MVVVIPAYEPDEKLLGVIEHFQEKAPSFPIIVVNDGSSQKCDSIFNAVRGMQGVTLLQHSVNKGKGCALKTAFKYIYDHYSDDGILTVDADGQHLIDDCLKVCKAWSENKGMLVTGSRRFKGNVPLRSRIGNSITRGVFHLTTGKRVYDTQTGLRAFSIDQIPQMLSLAGDRYEYEINQLLYWCTSGIDIYEEPIETVYIDDNQSSHFNTIRDSAKIYKVILKYLAPTFIKFMSTSFLSFLIDILGFLIVFYGIVSIFAGWNTAKQLFSFDRTGSLEALSAYSSTYPLVFSGGGTYLRIFSLAIARIISSICNYLLNKRYVFKAAREKSYFLRYVFVAVTILVLNSVFLELFTFLGLPAWLGNILSQIICYPASFFLQRTFVFKKGPQS